MNTKLRTIDCCLYHFGTNKEHVCFGKQDQAGFNKFLKDTFGLRG